MKKIDDLINQYINENSILIIPDNDLKELTEDEIDHIINSELSPSLFKLPKFEIDFFEWLKEIDETIWNDLWKKDDLSQQPYVVSMFFFDKILKSVDRGFPICDLLENDNYFFVPSHVSQDQSKVYIEIAKRKLKESSRMTLKELLLLEISTEAIDIWHFAYKYKLDLDKIKSTVTELREEGSLVHLRKSEDLASYIEF